MCILDKINKAKKYIKNIYSTEIDVAIILGSGLSSIVNDIKDKIVIKYSDIPGFPVSTVVGHAGELIIGNLNKKKVLVLNGRFHYYEGHNMEAVTFPVRVIKSLGINKLIVSNAAGGMNKDFKAGDLMVIKDQINLTGDNPLIGKNVDKLGPRFPDMSECYNKDLIKLAKEKANELHVKVQDGVYVAVSGPNYETKAELNMLINIGADAVGMSTVPEVIVANHMGMKVLGISCITDMAIPDQLEPLDHEKVIEVANKSMIKFVSLIKEVVKDI